MSSRLLAPKEAAELLGISEWTLAHWRVAGIGPEYAKLGKGPKAAVRYPEVGLSSFVEKSLRQSTTEVA